MTAASRIDIRNVTKLYGSVRAVNDVDLMLIPAAAVDRDGTRLGWGRGYFDKTLGSMERRPPTYAVVFDSEFVDVVPSEPHDQPVPTVLTAEGITSSARG